MSAIANIGTNVTAPYDNLTGLYYKEGSATNAILYNGQKAPEKLAEKVTALNEKELSNGKAVLLLNEDNPNGVWKLDTFTINGTEYKLPGFDGETVKAG